LPVWSPPLAQPHRKEIDMEELVARLAAVAGLDADTAQKAVAIILSFLEKEGPAGPVAHLVDAIPGARDLVNAEVNAEGSAGGLMGMLGGMLGGGGGGGITGLGGQLMGIGLDLGQMQTIGKELFAFAGDKAGPEVVGQIVSEIPGLGQFV
jgi:hypothetical protein